MNKAERKREKRYAKNPGFEAAKAANKVTSKYANKKARKRAGRYSKNSPFKLQD